MSHKLLVAEPRHALIHNLPLIVAALVALLVLAVMLAVSIGAVPRNTG